MNGYIVSNLQGKIVLKICYTTIQIYYYCNVHLKMVKMINFVMCFLLLLFSPSILSNSLWRHGLQHARVPCPSPILRACSNSCPLSQWWSNHLILCRPLLLLPSIIPSIRVFSNESALCIRWPKYWSFGLNISPSNEHPGLISFRMDWLDLLAVQRTLKSLLQHHSSKG